MARSGVIYAGTGCWKTTQIKWLAKYIAERTGKATLLLSMDGGGWAPCQPEIDVGMIVPFYCDPALAPMPTLRKISQGYWPEDSSAPSNRIDLLPIDFGKFGAIAIEGWTSIGSACSRYLSDNDIDVGGEDRSKLGGFEQNIQVSGSVVKERFRSTTRGDYKEIQKYLSGFVSNCNSLPFDYVLHTALEAKGEDDDKSTVYGPAIEGKKATAQCGPWIGDMLHGQDYAIPREIEVPDPTDSSKRVKQTIIDTTVRYYFKKHPDPVTGIMFPCKPRVTPEKMRELEKEFPGGYFEPTVDGGFDRYLAVVDRLTIGQADSLRGWREKMDRKLGRSVSLPPVATTIKKEATQ